MFLLTGKAHASASPDPPPRQAGPGPALAPILARSSRPGNGGQPFRIPLLFCPAQLGAFDLVAAMTHTRAVGTRALRWLDPPAGPAVVLLDQTRLPAEEAYLT